MAKSNQRKTTPVRTAAGKKAAAKAKPGAKRATTRGDVDYFLKSKGLDSLREKEIGQHIGYRYDVNLVPDYARRTPFLKRYIEAMGWPDLNWLEDVHMGYEEGRPAVFDRNINGWVQVPANLKLPDNQQDRDMLARELLIKFQMSPNHPLLALARTHRKA